MHTLWVILSWALVGLIVGLIARLLVPGRHPIGFLRTILLGIAGALLGGVIHWAIYHYQGEPLSFTQDSLVAWLFSILGAVILLLIWGMWQRRESGWRRWW
jgi:uncharacterized membrane protein YeaQ/YmgE (transglycosylase-associated protein family)